MEIKRKLEMLVVTKRRYVVRQAAPGRQIACAECGAPMLTAEQAANFLGITQRRIFQLIETEAAHYAETDAGAVMICLPSLTAVLDGKTRNNQHKAVIERENEHAKDKN
jgi:hypothetical protein